MKKKLITAMALFSFGIMLWAQTNNLSVSVARGEAVYKKECLSCHQVDGGGVPHMNPPLAQSSNVLKDKQKIITVVLKGMSDRIPLDDEYYSNVMASHSYLTDQQIADVLTYVRNSFGNKATAVTAAEVKAIRGPVKKTTSQVKKS
ncbi:Cytochrome c, mono-and diheme variants [Hydrobacter penzbergensis]|jgi:mono/diheme cytochrome c family protein|uniref:Cytochrome c, mono-and diheme variants n=1 Tax=Hydrobacter penzbergensis TaxID=1235997 RepID=A0A8X8LDQ2_9BACT|nr:cytochrome c [Hydrobacter penzbergensis]MBN8718760.1 cytochrome c [Sediminibacterium magnilacihabitans]PQV61756.1 mono/diheme cytochrome c family protein [Sediminibacterium magnilacihabitans]SDW21873.1 Cytochrome c, mono-and diheme variants [Hydrobacter penzbergensis]